MANEANTSAVVAATINAVTTESNVYDKVTDLLDGSRRAYADAATLAAVLNEIAAIDPAFQIAVAGLTSVDVLALTESDDLESDLCEQGEAGYMVSTIGTRGIVGADGKTRNGIIGVAIYPAHTVTAILERGDGEAYLTRLIEKEQGLVAFRGLRLQDGEELSLLQSAAAQMPVTLDDFLIRQTSTTGNAYSVFNDNWAAFRKMLIASPNTKAIVKLLPVKAEMLNCIRSESYASERYDLHESKGWFVKLANAMANVVEKAQETATANGVVSEIQGDAELIRTWIAQRDSVVIENVAAAATESAELDLGAFGA